jgi:ComF family protein
MTLKGLWKATLNLIYPPHCLGCGSSLHRGSDIHLCEGCGRAVAYVQNPRCPRCGAGLGPYGKAFEKGCTYCETLPLRFDAAFSAVYFNGVVRELIHHFKYERKEYLAKYLTTFIAKALDAGSPFTEDPDCVIPVPLYWRREMQRGFNQSKLLAQHTGRHLKIEVLPKCLSRVRDTPPQTSLNPTQREANVKGAFQARSPVKFKDKNILLVDDVLTTGLTASECARVLKRAGARKVYVLTIARAVGPDPGPW